MSTSDWHPDGLDAFFKSHYTYDDAERLAQLWNIPIVEAKQAIGHKIIHGIEDLLPEGIPAKFDHKPKFGPSDWDSKALDAFFSSNYTYDDAELLAQKWGGHLSIVEAKKTIGSKILNGDEKLLPEAIRGGSGATTDNPDKLLDAFFDSPYTFDDAELLAQLWSTDILEAKKTIGYKVLHGIEKFLPDKINRQANGC